MGDDDREFAAIRAVYAALEPLDVDARSRVIRYMSSRLDIDARQNLVDAEGCGDPQDGVADADASAIYGSFAELHNAANPGTNAEQALLAGYWLQVCVGGDSFDSQSANAELKNLGHGLANVTAALDALKNQKPALALQLRKSGRSQQARKLFKITMAGINRVSEMVA